MFSTFDFCLPTRGIKVPDRPEWIHEVKYDGYRLRVERDGDRVRLITRGGYNWTKRYPWIVEAALRNRTKFRTRSWPSSAPQLPTTGLGAKGTRMADTSLLPVVVGGHW
jgi:ATP dependent DNA ligase domain